MSQDAIPERGPNHGMELDPSVFSLHARWASQMSTTIYAHMFGAHGEVDPNRKWPYGVSVHPEDEEHAVVVRTDFNGLQQTHKEGAYVSSIRVMLHYTHDHISGAVVQFYKPDSRPTSRRKQQLLTETVCVAASNIEFMYTMSRLKAAKQADITAGLRSVGERLGIPLDDLNPAPHLVAAMRAARGEAPPAPSADLPPIADALPLSPSPEAA